MRKQLRLTLTLAAFVTLAAAAALAHAVEGVAARAGAALSQTRPRAATTGQTRPPGGFVRAEDFPGADVGAKINAAGNAYAGKDIEIRVSSGGNIATQVDLRPGHELHVLGGTYTASTPGPPFLLQNGVGATNKTTLRCGAAARLRETTAPEASPGVGYHAVTGQSVFAIVRDKASSGGSINNSSSYIKVTGCHFEGGRSADQFNSAHQTVSLGNCDFCEATHNTFTETNAIGLQIGGGAGEGHYANDSVLNDNEFYGVASQNLAVVNSARVQVLRNKFYRPGQVNGPGVSIIDVEPNVGDIIDDILIKGNLLDCSQPVLDANGQKSTNGIVVNGHNVLDYQPPNTQKFRNVRVLDNRILGQVAGPRAHNYSGIAYAGILLRRAKDTTVSGNTVTEVPWGILADADSLQNVIRNNTLDNCGSGSTVPIKLSDGARQFSVRNNVLRSVRGSGYANYILSLAGDLNRARIIHVDANSSAGCTHDISGNTSDAGPAIVVFDGPCK